MLTETDALTAHYITKRMLREVRRYKPTRRSILRGPARTSGAHGT
jgi:hypothetical protein